MLIFRKLEKTITGTIDGKPFNMPRTDEAELYLADVQSKGTANHKDIVEYVKSARNQEIAGSNEYLMYRPLTKEYFLVFKGYRSKQAIPPVLVEYIETSYEKDIDFLPVLKAFALLLSNPRCNDEMVRLFANYLSTTYVDNVEVERLMVEDEIDKASAIAIATYQDIAITQEGLLATYKVADIVTWQYEMVEDEDGNFTKVKNNRFKKIPAVLDTVTGEVITPESFKKPDHLEDYLFTPCIIKNGHKFFSGDKLGYVYEVGKMQYLPKEAPRNLNNTGGGGGLYSGGLKYIEHFRNMGSHILTCFVSPADLLSFQSEGHAFRTDALMPNNVWDEDIPLKGTYHSSEYGAKSTERLNDLMELAVADGVSILEEQKSMPNE